MSEQATLPPPVKVTGPGVYEMTAAEYHADPVPGGSLSSTGARRLLPPSCPALFAYDREHPEPPKQTFEIGTAAHKLVLGVGPELVRIDAEEWRTNAVKAEVAAVRERGAVPLKPGAYDAVHAMADAIRAHPFAGRLFAPGTGRAEQVLVWQDKATGVWCRALLDWLRFGLPGLRFFVPDYKTAACAAPDKVGRVIADHGYHVQLAWYLRGVRALDLGGEDAAGLLVMQEKAPPFLVTVVQPDRDAMRLGEMRCREALEVYAECARSGRWPGYADDVVLAELPPWETRELEGQIW